MRDTTLSIDDLSVQLFADGADLVGLKELAALSHISGFTTNPTLMRKAGVSDYCRFAREALDLIGDRPLSLEVFSDDPREMLLQAREIASWGGNVFVKIPVSTLSGRSTAAVVQELSRDGIQVNVTALMTLRQVEEMTSAVEAGVASNISVFAGRIADTGRDPLPIMRKALEIIESAPNASLIWASPREVLNIVQAAEIGCHIITVTYDLLGKLGGLGKSLEAFSLETVEMFYRDACESGFTIKVE
jgi:transaldolase